MAVHRPCERLGADVARRGPGSALHPDEHAEQRLLRRVSRVATEYRTSGNPMTYRSRAGRQFILIATGGGTDASLVALSLSPE